MSRAYFDVGIVAKNDVLQAEVRLANAKQGQVNADNLLALAKSSFNTLLRREINAPLNIVDILDLPTFKLHPGEQHRRGASAEAGDQGRRVDCRAGQAGGHHRQERLLSLRSAWPETTAKTADDSDLNGRWNERYTVQALATLAFSDWWRLGYKVGESKVRVTQAQEAKYQVVDNIILEVKQNYINMMQSEKNIDVAQKSIEQAEENLRLERGTVQVPGLNADGCPQCRHIAGAGKAQLLRRPDRLQHCQGLTGTGHGKDVSVNENGMWNGCGLKVSHRNSIARGGPWSNVK